MGQQIKLLNKAKRNPDGLSFFELQALMTQCEWIKDRQRGSHQIWYSLEGIRISIQNRNGVAKGYQVRQFLSSLKGEER
jgi:hypothetical protein